MTGAQYRHSAHPSAGSALVPPNLPHFCAAYGRLILVFKPPGLRLQRRTRPRAMPFQAPRWGGIAEAYGCTSPEGVGGTGAAAGFVTPEGEVGTSADAPVPLTGVHRGWADCEQGPALGGRSRTGGTPPMRVFAYFLRVQKVGRPGGETRRRKVRFASFPPKDGENCASLPCSSSPHRNR